jgi:hypothetical protein
MTILPDPAPPSAQTRPDTEAMGKTDACPECLWNVEWPRSVSPTADGFRADYLCSDCGQFWNTSWKD